MVDKIISERDVLFSDIKLIDCDCEGKSIVEFSVKRRVERDSDSDYSEQIVPFQIAYAVSIHKAQGLEYKSVKVVITEDIDEKISHNIFYTAITRTNNQYEINIILYTGAVGIERLQKIYLCLVLQNPTDKESVPKCLVEHNHHELEKEIEKYTTEQLSKNGRSLLGVFSNYYNNYRYANYIPGKNSSELRKLFISFLKKQNGKFNFDEPCALIQFDAFKRFYINELGKLARYYFELIEHKARDINTYTYEIDSYSNAARVFLSTQRRSFYEQMVIEQNSIKELLLYMYKNKRESGAFRLLNDMESLEMDDALVNDYLADLCEGKVNNWLIDYVDELYEEMEDIKKRKERKELLALIGNRSVLFDFDDFEDDENESYHRNMFESDDIEGGENL